MPNVMSNLALAACLSFAAAMPAAIPDATILEGSDSVIEARQALPSGANGAPYLNSAATSKGKVYFGTAVSIPGTETSDKEYMTILNDTSSKPASWNHL